MSQVLECHVQRSLLCHDLNLVDLGSNNVQLTKQYQLDSLLQEVCTYDLSCSNLKLMGSSVGNYYCWYYLIVFLDVMLCPGPGHCSG